MHGRRHINPLGRLAKEGRPSNLALYRSCWCPAESITPLRDVPVDCADWFQRYGGRIFRTFSTGEATDLFDIPDRMRDYIQTRLEKINLNLKSPRTR